MDWNFYSKRRKVSLERFLGNVKTLEEALAKFKARSIIPPSLTELKTYFAAAANTVQPLPAAENTVQPLPAAEKPGLKKPETKKPTRIRKTSVRKKVSDASV